MTNRHALLTALRDGQAVVVATDTVYGLMARPGTRGHEEIFELKGRPADQALPCFVDGVSSFEECAADPGSHARRLAETFWPGPLTLVVRASDKARDLGAAALDGTIALRCPDDAGLLDVLGELECPVACTSANVHGESTALEARDLPQAMRELAGAEDLPATCSHDGASTIVDCTGDYPKILREGPIPEQVVLDVACFGARLTAHA